MTTTKLPTEMLACQIVEINNPPEIRKIPTPSSTDLKPYDLFLKVAVAGLCHSDLEYIKGNLPAKLPATASHEGTGTVMAMGDAVKNFKIGDRVLAGQTFGRCGDCEICNGPENYRHYCPKREPMMTMGRNGAFQQFLVVDSREAAHIPDSMSFTTAAPLACAGVTSWRAILQCELKPGEWVGVVGSGGGLGHLAIQFAKAKGLKVVGVDARDEGLALSKEFGADAVLDARKGLDSMIEEVQKVTGARGVQASINLSDAKSAAATASGITRDHGVMVQVAVIDNVCVPMMDLIFRNVRVKGSFMASQAEIQEMLNAVEENKIKVENNVFHGLHEIPRAVEMLKNAQYRGKACIVIDENAPGLRS